MILNLRARDSESHPPRPGMALFIIKAPARLERASLVESARTCRSGTLGAFKAAFEKQTVFRKQKTAVNQSMGREPGRLAPRRPSASPLAIGVRGLSPRHAMQ